MKKVPLMMACLYCVSSYVSGYCAFGGLNICEYHKTIAIDDPPARNIAFIYDSNLLAVGTSGSANASTVASGVSYTTLSFPASLK